MVDKLRYRTSSRSKGLGALPGARGYGRSLRRRHKNGHRRPRVFGVNTAGLDGLEQGL
ncbi:hypothetical protein StoSoilB3_00900 [Arthrobacter sp. StoSoilB3]|nr:hypothetical protein NtRootA2_01000 [Arthrobacter sp. NtRootA2]BCW17009.1 hypothetical protein NtRootA4_39880 [Arthrobacter sp. NtRootA4]BCW21233.1 hypothetical protein NtRootC7_01000 [Arthrobacter sp. NtRootC7]BCW25500.1 hypothetical protein NtRootC45_01000 [Arthrobacter sp. NtRootC45]BCW29769.1 hypothetical protein NtRootD5_01000 [Arthrobacter sp. NtRootD5]BCW38555.1 hypothetical protein StoSoilB3_00900 [Arthrobacter sp. StoSoilB3]